MPLSSARRPGLRALAALALLAPLAAPAQAAPDLVVDHVVMVMRHGVRPPTKAQPLPPQATKGAWPTWAVAPGWLTPHGAQAITRLGAADADHFRQLGLIPAQGCAASGTIRVVADSDQRTLATAQAWLAGAAPGCGVPMAHQPQDEKDPLFSPVESGLLTLDPARADAAIAQAVGAGGLAALDTAYAPLLARLDGVLCGAPAAAGCGVRGEPTAISPAQPNRRPKLSGQLDRASTAAQSLLLEYGDGKPLEEVGWGRASAQDIAALSAFHALEFRLMVRPPYLAQAQFSQLMPILRAGLAGPASITLISGHDTNVANLAGILGAHWQVPGLAQDDPAPGGALIVERLHDKAGQHYIRVAYRAQGLEQIRSAAPLGKGQAYVAPQMLAGCHALGVAGLCSEEQFAALLDTGK